MTTLGGVFLIAIGALFGYWRLKRRFDRTNPYGVEEFSSYSRKVMARTKDNLLGLTSFVLLTVGTQVLAFQYEDSWGWAVLLPVYLLILYMMLGT